MTFELVINNTGEAHRITHHEGLVDARRQLIRYQAGHGLRITIGPWADHDGLAVQTGELMAGMDIIGQWAISYPLEDGAELPPYGVERLPA